MRRAARSPRAFTLLEALIAVGMILLLAGALAIFVEDLARTRAHVTAGTDRSRSAAAIFNLVESALQTAVVDGGSHGAGISGTPTGLRVLSSRTDAIGNTSQEMVRAAFAPLVVTEISQSGEGVVVGRAGAASTLPAPIGTIQFRYFDGTQWADSYDSLTQGRLPTMVEVSVWFFVRAPSADVEESVNGAEDTEGAAGVEPAKPAEPLAFDMPAPDRVRRIAVPDALASDGQPEDAK